MKKLIASLLIAVVGSLAANTGLAFDETFERAKSLAIKFGTSQGGFFSRKDYVLIREILLRIISSATVPYTKGLNLWI